MEFEDFCNGSEGRQTKSGSDTPFWSCSDEELDTGYPIDISGKYRQNGGSRLVIFALIEGINDDQGWDVSGFKWANNELLDLGTKGFSPDVRARDQNRNQFFPKARVMVGQLEGEGGENFLGISPVFEITRAEEARAKLPVYETHLRKRLGNSRLSSSGEAAEPEDALILFPHQPILELEEDTLPCALQAPWSVPGVVIGTRGMVHIGKQGEIQHVLFVGHYMRAS